MTNYDRIKQMSIEEMSDFLLICLIVIYVQNTKDFLTTLYCQMELVITIVLIIANNGLNRR